MAGVGGGEDWLEPSRGYPEGDPLGDEGPTGYATAAAEPEGGVDRIEWLLTELTRLLSERLTRQGGRTVLVVPIDQRTLDQARAAFGEDVGSKAALGIARELGAWKHAQDRKQGLIVDGKKVG